MTSTIDPSEYLNTAQAAARLCVSTQQMRLWRHKSEGPVFYRFSRTVRYKASDLEAFIAASKVGR